MLNFLPALCRFWHSNSMSKIWCRLQIYSESSQYSLRSGTFDTPSTGAYSFIWTHDISWRQDWVEVGRFWNRLWLNTTRPQLDSLFKFLNLIQIGAVLLPDVFGSILCCNVRRCQLAPFVALTFCVKSGAHDGVFEFCTEVGAFALELLPGICPSC